MPERLVCSDYKITFDSPLGPFEIEFELWTETGLREPNWWLMFGGVEQDDGQLTEAQIKATTRYVTDWLVAKCLDTPDMEA